jgi:integrase
VGRALRLPAILNRLAERILPEADLHRILSLEQNPRNWAILTLLYASGVRVSELCGLSWRDLQPNEEGGQITVFGKGGVTRSIQVSVSVWKLISVLRTAKIGANDPVFRSAKGKTEDGSAPWLCSASSAKRLIALASNSPSRPIGSATRMLRTPSIGGHPFTWYRPPSDTPASQRPDAARPAERQL